MFTSRHHPQAMACGPSDSGRKSFTLFGGALCIVTVSTERSLPIVEGFT